jgi:DNA mismatch endonuclease (patch repair protein)
MDGYRPLPRKVQPLSEAVTKYMRSNRGKDTKPEVVLRKALFANGIRGYRLHWKKAPGRPDIAFPGRKVAVYIHGCFWHRCPTCNLPMPKHNAEFWEKKFSNNVLRDVQHMHDLAALGWRGLVIWECELKANVENQVIKVAELLQSA